MKVKIYPQPLSGKIKIPGSKSLTHRALICASLAEGETVITNPLISDDTLATINCLRSMGVKVEILNDIIKINGVKRLIVTDDLEILESASTLRFLIPLISLWNEHFTIKTSPRLIERIKTIDLQALLGLEFTFNLNNIEVKGKLHKHLTLTDDITTQWISGVLFTLPYTLGSLTVNKLDNSYILMTLEMMKEFNVGLVSKNNILSYHNGNYIARKVFIEGDFSTAAFFLTAAVFNNLQIEGVNLDSIQGDVAILSFLKKMGLTLNIANNAISISNARPKACELDLSLNPDLVPIMASLLSLSQGTSVLTGLEKLQYKESNRLKSTYKALKTVGANIEIVDNKLIIVGKNFLNGDAVINGHNDHRIIMSLVAISSQIKKPYIITDCEAVNKSNPRFFDQIKELGGIYEYQV